MDRPAPPLVFAPARRDLARRRALRLQGSPGAARYLLDDMVEDVIERLGFLRHQPQQALVIGDWSGRLVDWLRQAGCTVEAVDPVGGFAEEQPFPNGSYDLVANLGTLDTVNDLPGALIHIRQALAPGGLALASFPGAGSLPALRAALLAADGERPAPRLHPMVDVRAAGQLLQRAGWADPVIDSRTLEVRFSSFAALIADLRAQSLVNVLARPGPALTRSQRARAEAEFAAPRVEPFEILTLSGWKRPATGLG
jgi:SAM-dependent methyltransferase